MGVACPLCKEQNGCGTEECPRCGADLRLLLQTRAAAEAALALAVERAATGDRPGAQRRLREARLLWRDLPLPEQLERLALPEEGSTPSPQALEPPGELLGARRRPGAPAAIVLLVGLAALAAGVGAGLQLSRGGPPRTVLSSGAAQGPANSAGPAPVSSPAIPSSRATGKASPLRPPEPSGAKLVELSPSTRAQLRRVEETALEGTYRLAWGEVRRGRPDQALLLFRRTTPFVGESDHAPEVLYGEVLCLLRLRRRREAVSRAAALVRRHPRSAWSRRVRRLLGDGTG